jgi:hypothetical protein
MRVPLGSLLLLGTITLAAAEAFAADNKPVPYPPCSTVPTEADKKGAKGAFEAGNASYEEADYATAVTFWRDAYRRDCTAHAMLINLANAYERKGDRAETVNALETYLQRKPDEPKADMIQRRIQNLKAQMATPALAPVPAPVAAPQQAPAPPVVAAPAKQTSGASSVPAEPPPAPSGKKATGPIILASAGGVMALVGGVVAWRGNNKIRDAEITCPNRQCPVVPDGDPSAAAIVQAKDRGNSGRKEVTIGVAVAGVGIATAVGGLVWYFTMPKAPAGVPPANKTSFVPTFAPGFAGVSLTRSF